MTRPTENSDGVMPFTLYIRVRYGECDPQQVVFNARYGDYVDLAMSEFFRAIFGAWQKMLDRGLDCQVVRLLTEWQHPARFDDVLALQVATQAVGNTSFRIGVTMLRANDGQAIATAEASYVLVNTSDYRKTPVPQDLRERLLAGAPGVEVDHAAWCAK
ncbi:MAG: thioesterase family protein [Oleiphilaceae bacterium]|nr:thioesterase family protein [Oleiphilaceae bacterium]